VNHHFLLSGFLEIAGAISGIAVGGSDTTPSLVLEHLLRWNKERGPNQSVQNMDDNDEYINESGDDEYTYDDLSDDEYVYDVDTANSFAEAKVCISQGINGTPSDKYHYSARDSKNNSTDKNEGKDNSFTTSENSNSGGDARKHRKNDRNSNLQVIEGKVVIQTTVA
jgi:hypothetical protein